MPPSQATTGPLVTEVKGKPDSIRGTARWLATAADTVRGSGDRAHRAGGMSETGWTGRAGDGFRGTAQDLRGKTADLGGLLSSTRNALDVHANDLDGVIREMAHARQVAVGGGLTVTPTTIDPPGPAPAAPPELPADRLPTPGEREAHNEAVGAMGVYRRREEAFRQAAGIVVPARDKERQSQDALAEYLFQFQDVAPVKFGLLAGSVAGGLSGEALGWSSRLRSRADGFRSEAARRAGLAGQGGLWNKLKNSHLERVNLNRAGALDSRAAAWERNVGKIPTFGRAMLAPTTWNAGMRLPELATDASRIARSGAAFAKNVPFVGTAITAVGVGFDIHEGKDPKEAIVTGASSLAAGAAAGAVVGSFVPIPFVGTLAGAAVGYGVGAAIDAIWD